MPKSIPSIKTRTNVSPWVGMHKSCKSRTRLMRSQCVSYGGTGKEKGSWCLWLGFSMCWLMTGSWTSLMEDPVPLSSARQQNVQQNSDWSASGKQPFEKSKAQWASMVKSGWSWRSSSGWQWIFVTLAGSSRLQLCCSTLTGRLRWPNKTKNH